MKTIFSTLLILSTLFSFAQTNYTLNGNLGVGESPTHKLSVAGDSKMTGELTVTDKTKLEADLEVSGDLKLVNVATTGTALERLLYVDTDGKVQRITAQMWDDLIMMAGAQYSIECADWGVNQEPTWAHSPGVLFANGGACGFPLQVGINTNSPSATFEIHPSVSNNSADVLAINNATEQKVFTVDVDGTTAIHQQAPGDHSFVVKNENNEDNLLVRGSGEIRFFNQELNAQPIKITDINGQETFNIKGNGAVRIFGQLAATKTFSIRDEFNENDVFRIMGNGHVWATEVHVRLKENFPFPDYVFEDDYNLMSLEELRAYIKSNKKLPNMPTAERVASEGLDLGETDRLLTEKVEELTLYILLLNDKIEALIQENKVMKLEIEK